MSNTKSDIKDVGKSCLGVSLGIFFAPAIVTMFSILALIILCIVLCYICGFIGTISDISSWIPIIYPPFV